MAISSRKITAFTNLIAALADVPVGMTSTQLKTYWDSSPEELRLKLNGLIDDLLLTTDGNSGADNIGATTIAGLTGNTVQSLLEAITTGGLDGRYYTETEVNNLLAAVNDNISLAILGQIPDGSVTLQKLAFDPATQAELDAVNTTHNDFYAKRFRNSIGGL